MPRVELRDYRKARTPFGSLLRLFRYFRHCRTIMICAVASILVYVAATIAASYCMKPLVNLLKQTGLAPSEVYAKYLALLLGLAGLYALSAVTNYLLNRLMRWPIFPNSDTVMSKEHRSRTLIKRSHT